MITRLLFPFRISLRRFFLLVGLNFFEFALEFTFRKHLYDLNASSDKNLFRFTNL